jgi:hypothetical protein
MPITLESRIRRMLVVNLPHDTYCRGQCGCAETTVVVAAENPRTGDRASKHVSKHLPASMTWLALERRVDLPTVLLDVPDIRAAIGRGQLRLVEQTPDPAPVVTSRSAATAAPASSKSAPAVKEA